MSSSLITYLCWTSKFYDYYVFGNGIYPIIPLFWFCWGLLYNILYLYYVTNFLIFVAIFAGLLDLGINLYFGYQYLQSNQLQKFLTFYRDKYSIQYEQHINYMHLTCFFFFLLFVLISVIFCIRNYYVSPGSLTAVLLIIITYIPFTIIGVGSSIYLCIIWCYEMYIIEQALLLHVLPHLYRITPLDNNETSCSIDEQPFSEDIIITDIPTENPLRSLQLHNEQHNNSFSLAHKQQRSQSSYYYNKYTAERLIFPFLQEMRSLSNSWKWNHIMRCLTGVIIGFTEMIIVAGGTQETAFVISDSIVAIVYFGIIWITALSAGYVNDKYFKMILRELANMYQQQVQGEDMNDEEKCLFGETDKRVDEEVITTITKLNSIRQVDGLHFAGVIMSMEKAFSVGSILVSLIIFGIRFFAQ